jgi:hypothetical protein
MAAIYIPPQASAEIWTTTLYPVVISDAVVFGVRVAPGWMALIPEDFVQWSMGLQGGTMVQERWFITDGPYDDDVQWSIGLQGGTLIQERWFIEDGPYDDTIQWSMGLQDGTLINKLIHGDTPDDLLQLGARPAPGSMTLI